jgi:hypothetical protein
MTSPTPTADALDLGDEEQWLLDALSRLISTCGPDPFVAAPVLLADDAHFPDTFDRDAVGVRTLIRRSLRHAALGELHVDLELAPETSVGESESPVIFTSLDHGHVGFELHGRIIPKEKAALIGFLSFEMGHAFRASRSLDSDAVPYRDQVDAEEAVVEQLAAVTAVYLGFGVIATNAAHAYVSENPVHDLATHADYAHSMAGGLSADRLAWLLAVQSVVRDEGRKAVGHVRAALSPNQRAVFVAALKTLTPLRPALQTLLGLPDADAWPRPTKLDLADLELEEADAELAEQEENEAEAEAEAHGRSNRTVYPVDRTRPWLQVIIVSMFIGAFFGQAALMVTGIGLFGWIFQIGGFVLAVTWLRLPRLPECSETSCRAEIPVHDEVCPSCGAEVVDPPDG